MIAATAMAFLLIAAVGGLGHCLRHLGRDIRDVWHEDCAWGADDEDRWLRAGGDEWGSRRG